MPLARNKLLLNSRTTKGMHKAINEQYESLDDLTAEILNNGWINETGQFRDEMKKACAEHDAADEKYYQFLKDLAARMSDWVDKKLTTP